MDSQAHVVHAREEPPRAGRRRVFLAGPVAPRPADDAGVRGNGPHGEVHLGERTCVEAAAFAEIRAARLVDRAALGMIAEVLTGPR